MGKSSVLCSYVVGIVYRMYLPYVFRLFVCILSFRNPKPETPNHSVYTELLRFLAGLHLYGTSILA